MMEKWKRRQDHQTCMQAEYEIFDSKNTYENVLFLSIVL